MICDIWQEGSEWAVCPFGHIVLIAHQSDISIIPDERERRARPDVEGLLEEDRQEHEDQTFLLSQSSVFETFKTCKLETTIGYPSVIAFINTKPRSSAASSLELSNRSHGRVPGITLFAMECHDETLGNEEWRKGQ
jgi:hypothetical protein